MAMISPYSETPHGSRIAPQSYFEIQEDSSNGDSLADRYQVLEELGSGSFGVVYKAIEKATGEIVAVKHVRPQLGLRERTFVLIEPGRSRIL